MTAPSVGVKDLLVDAAVGVYGTAGDWQIIISKLLDKSDQCIALYDTGGLTPNPRWALDFPGVTIHVRGKDYLSTYDKAKQVRDVLLGLPSQVINGDNWDGVLQIGETMFLGYDQKDRPMFSLNFRLFLEPAISTLTNRDPL